MTKDVSRTRHSGAPTRHSDSAPPPGMKPAARQPALPRVIPLAFLFVLSLSLVLFSSQLLTAPVAADSADSATSSVDSEEAWQDVQATEDVPQAREAEEEEPVADGAVAEDASGEGWLEGRQGLSSRGGLRPAPSMAAQVSTVARQYEGAPYRWAGASPAGFDCSGFTMYVYGQVGMSVPRDHWGQWNTGKQVSIDDLQPGDILFFENTYARGLSHSGIYLGENQFIHAETERTGVVISQLRGSQWEWGFVGASRPYED